MKTHLHSSNKFICTTALIALVASTFVGCAQGNDGSSGGIASSTPPDQKICAANENDIFTEINTPQESVTELSDSSRRVLQRRAVKVDFDTLKAKIRNRGARARLNLFDNRSVTVQVTDVQGTGNRFVAQGYVEGQPNSEVTLSVNDDVLMTNIHDHDTDENYEVRTTSDGTHMVEALEATDSDCEAIEAPDQAVAAEDTEEIDSNPLAPTPVVDMLVAYTPAALTRVGSLKAMEALIQMGIADTNRAYIDSGVPASVRLVGILKLTQNETSNFSTDLGALRSKTDGKWDAVHAERARLGADQVTLIGGYTANSSVAGIGYINAAAASAFTIVKSTTFGQYTFSHELGHNIGLNHSDGMENTSGRFRTVMAYGTYKRVKRFSNPSLPYNGYATGTSSKDSAKILRSNIGRTANLLAPVVKPGAEPLPSTPAPPAPEVTCP